MIGVLRLQASTQNEFVTIGPVRLVRVTFPGKYRLDVMIPLVVSSINPDPFRLVYRWYSHSLPPV